MHFFYWVIQSHLQGKDAKRMLLKSELLIQLLKKFYSSNNYKAAAFQISYIDHLKRYICFMSEGNFFEDYQFGC